MLELSNVSTFQSLLFLFWANVICRSLAVAILTFHDYIRYSLKCDDPTRCLQVKCCVEKNTSGPNITAYDNPGDYIIDVLVINSSGDELPRDDCNDMGNVSDKDDAISGSKEKIDKTQRSVVKLFFDF